jgi:hypothetical protein
MRGIVTALAMILAMTAGVVHAGLEGSCVNLVSPEDPIEPGETYVYMLRLDRDLSSSEYVTEIDIVFPPGMLPLTFTMGFDELEPGRPSFNQWPYLETASWWEQDTENGGIHMGESMEFWVTVSTWEGLPEGAEGTIM